MRTSEEEEVSVRRLLQLGKTLSLKTAFSLDMRVIDVLEYVHSYEYIHADARTSVLLLCVGKGAENKVYVVYFGLACRYTRCGMHKEDLRKALDGTFEFASRDADIGAHSRRGDMEILGYNLHQWLPCGLPWEDILKDPEYISQQGSSLVEDISLLMSKCFPHGEIPYGITEFLQYVASMKFEGTADCKQLKRVSQKGVEAAVFNPDGRLLFTPTTPWRSSFSRRKPVLQEVILAEDSTSEIGNENAVGKPPPGKVRRGSRTASVRKQDRGFPTTTKSASGLGGLVRLKPERKTFKKKGVAVAARTIAESTLKNSFCEGRNSRGLDKPLRPCWKCFISSRPYWSNSRKGVVTLPAARYCPSPPWLDVSLSRMQTCNDAVLGGISNARRLAKNYQTAIN